MTIKPHNASQGLLTVLCENPTDNLTARIALRSNIMHLELHY